MASADGTAVCYSTAPYLRPTLRDPLTGEALASHFLPLFPDYDQWENEKNPSGIIYDDGTVLLYSKYDSNNESETKFRAALLRPGDDEWTVVERTLESPWYGEFCVAYHAGKIFVTVERSLWLVVTPPNVAASDVDDFLVVIPSSMPLHHDEDGGYFYEYSHVLQSRGELLWASVHISVDYPEEYRKGVVGLAGALSVSVHALQEAPNPRWVRKKGESLADRVLFLGWPNSFAVDASRLGVTGGCAYFKYEHDNERASFLPHERHGVFRYNFINGTTEFVEWLPGGWDDEMCAWLIPQPSIAPIVHLMQEGPSNTPRTSINNSMIHTERQYGPCFRVLVRNLPLSTNSTQLQHLFSKHGRASGAGILYYKKTKHSQGIGFVTMSTVHDRQEDAIDALNGLLFEGCRLEVVLVKVGRPRYRRRRRSGWHAPQRHVDRLLGYIVIAKQLVPNLLLDTLAPSSVSNLENEYMYIFKF